MRTLSYKLILRFSFFVSFPLNKQKSSHKLNLSFPKNLLLIDCYKKFKIAHFHLFTINVFFPLSKTGSLLYGFFRQGLKCEGKWSQTFHTVRVMYECVVERRKFCVKRKCWSDCEARQERKFNAFGFNKIFRNRKQPGSQETGAQIPKPTKRLGKFSELLEFEKFWWSQNVRGNCDRYRISSLWTFGMIGLQLGWFKVQFHSSIQQAFDQNRSIIWFCCPWRLPQCKMFIIIDQHRLVKEKPDGSNLRSNRCVSKNANLETRAI